MWAKGGKHGFGVSEKPAARKSGRLRAYVTAVSLLLVLVLSSSAFFVSDTNLPVLCIFSGILVLHGLLLRGNISVIGRVFMVQLVITMSLYYLLHGRSQMAQGLIAGIYSWMVAIGKHDT